MTLILKNPSRDMMKSMSLDVHQILSSGAERTDRALERLLPRADTTPSSIHKAMRYSTFAGGKRLRPTLCMEAARMVQGRDELPDGVDDLGAAIEMLHTYSLVHDDLPALDNDDLRRGKPTCHVVFGEAIAILAGDALQTLAYQTLAALRCPSTATVSIVAEVARATGTVEGMIGGQVMDVEGEGETPTAGLVEAIHRAKTGALITASLVTGVLYAGADKSVVEHLRRFGQRAGLAFQIVDDVLDVTQSSEQLGKTAGKDTATVKATWPAVYGVERSLRDARELIDSAFAELDGFGAVTEPLKAVARYLVERKS
jgi:geranylgeranyl diphosphate synthase type II